MKKLFSPIILLLLLFTFTMELTAQHTVVSSENQYSNADRHVITVNDTLFSTADTSITASYDLPHVENTATFVRKYTQANDSIYVAWVIQGYDATTASWYSLASGTDSVATALKTSVTLEPFTVFREYYDGSSAKNGETIILKSSLLMNKKE